MTDAPAASPIPTPGSLAIVTGAAGWLGARFVEALRRGLPDVEDLREGSQRPVRCLALDEAEEAKLRGLGLDLEIVRGDLSRDGAWTRELFAGAEGATLFHVAGLVHPKLFVRDLWCVNAEGLRRLLEGARGAGVRRFVAISSNSPVGLNPSRDALLDEDSPARPYMAYGRSKAEMERLVNEARKGGLETVILRPPWFYGPGQPPRQTLFFTMIRKGGAPILGDGGQLRSMAYVDNTAQAMLRAERVPDAAGRTYWIADRRPYPMREVVDTVERLLESEFGMPCAHKRLRLPDATGDVARLADAALQAVGLYHPKIHVLGEMNATIACSIARAERELGYRPAIDLEEGMRRSIRWCVERGIAI